MDGILVIDKPEGVTSHDVVNSVRKIAQTRKVGHAGTLDPFATGVLVIGLNQGTKALTFLKGDDKDYEATLVLGAETDTLDRDGRVVKETPCPDISLDRMEGAMTSFIGIQDQVPPRFAAIKKDGVPLYKLAREGIEFEAPSRRVEIYGITVLNIDMPHVSFRVRCSSGTYIRSLARDIGIKAGCGGYLKSLRRIRSGRFDIKKAIPLDRLKSMGERWHEAAMGLRDALHLPEITVEPEMAEMIRMGKKLAPDKILSGGLAPEKVFMLTCNNGLVAVAETSKEGRVDILRVFNP